MGSSEGNFTVHIGTYVLGIHMHSHPSLIVKCWVEPSSKFGIFGGFEFVRCSNLDEHVRLRTVVSLIFPDLGLCTAHFRPNYEVQKFGNSLVKK